MLTPTAFAMTSTHVSEDSTRVGCAMVQEPSTIVDALEFLKATATATAMCLTSAASVLATASQKAIATVMETSSMLLVNAVAHVELTRTLMASVTTSIRASENPTLVACATVPAPFLSAAVPTSPMEIATATETFSTSATSVEVTASLLATAIVKETSLTL